MVRQLGKGHSQGGSTFLAHKIAHRIVNRGRILWQFYERESLGFLDGIAAEIAEDREEPVLEGSDLRIILVGVEMDLQEGLLNKVFGLVLSPCKPVGQSQGDPSV